MQIRKYEDRDENDLVALWQKLFPDDPPHNAPKKVIAEKRRVDDLIFVVEQDSALIGACMAGYDGHRGWLYAVGVLPDYRRTGMGAALVEHAMAELRQIGCKKLNLQIRSTNTQVAAFYKSLGFEIEDRLSMGILIEQNSPSLT